MKKAYFNIERQFERLVSIATKILGNSISFIIAFILVIFWWITNLPTSKNLHQNIGDIIFGTTFLSLFIIQKSFNRYSALIHLKMNELISSHKAADNSVMNTSQKTEKEIREMSREYIETVESVEKELDNVLKDTNIENKI
ncbi:low affinity iron permease family protein [Flavobacterium sp.]|uniref:low affinity iron permease family protein n=1 Tax=Flavobacterium sp. TaxID=239 RepID=UPI003752A799